MSLGGRGAFYRFGCNACHLPGAAVRAPRLDGLFDREVKLRNGQSVIADESYLRESILQPNAKIVAGYDMPSLMPTYQGQIDEPQLMEIIEFIKSITHGWPEGETPTLNSEGDQTQ
jgi:cytochrome c oxidase subunit 2